MEQLTSIETGRANHCAVVLEDLIFITDQDGHSCLKSVESYDPSTNQWRKVPDLANAHRVAVAATVDVWGKIIVVGGCYDMNGFPSAVVEQTCEVRV